MSKIIKELTKEIMNEVKQNIFYEEINKDEWKLRIRIQVRQ